MLYTRATMYILSHAEYIKQSGFTRVFLYAHVKKLRQEHIYATCLAVLGWAYNTDFTRLFCMYQPRRMSVM
jgi:hypothetical protein